VGDIARANVLALTQGGGEILNLGSGIGTTINTIFALLNQATGGKYEELHGPAKLGEVMYTYLDAQRAKQLLGWVPEVPLDEGLRRTVAHFAQ
jgi:UDP-glucose 4-epimerase